MNLKSIIDFDVIYKNIDFSVKINKIASDSRKIEKNDVFFAIKGENKNGNDYVEQAIKNGAIAIVTDDKGIEKSLPVIIVNNTRSALARAWSNYYGNPTRDMKVIAITGTNGKSSTAELLYSILISANKKCGLISTIRCLINGEEINHGGGSEVSDKFSAMTTPDPEVLYYILNKMKEKNIEYVIIETSSHALKQCKLDGVSVDIGVFTNLSHEHLDYHKNIEDYFCSKELLLKCSNLCVINVDDEYGEILYEKYKEKSASVSCNKGNDFYATENVSDFNGTKFTFNFAGGELDLESNLCGKFAVYNALMASSVAKIIGIPNENIRYGILNLKSIKGRLEKYKNKSIYIDYAHTPHATQMVLESIRGFEKNKKIISLFGCGGDRDKKKRKEIGRIASKLSDVVIVTSDNPRSENPLSIIKDILAGIDKNKIHFVIPSRKEAISFAVKMYDENTVIVLLGKGHEAYEIDETGKHFFDERMILNEAFDI